MSVRKNLRRRRGKLLTRIKGEIAPKAQKKFWSPPPFDGGKKNWPPPNEREKNSGPPSNKIKKILVPPVSVKDHHPSTQIKKSPH